MVQISLDNLASLVLDVEYDPAAQWLSITATHPDGTEFRSGGFHLEAPE